MTVESFFKEEATARLLFDSVLRAIRLAGDSSMRVSKSQIAFKRKTGFAWVWIPGRYLKGKTAPLVLTIGLRRQDLSPRWKEVAEPYPGRFVHHLELFEESDIDDEVRALLAEAWETAG